MAKKINKKVEQLWRDHYAQKANDIGAEFFKAWAQKAKSLEENVGYSPLNADIAAFSMIAIEQRRN